MMGRNIERGGNNLMQNIITQLNASQLEIVIH